jgi:hypothetical protein
LLLIVPRLPDVQRERRYPNREEQEDALVVPFVLHASVHEEFVVLVHDPDPVPPILIGDGRLLLLRRTGLVVLLPLLVGLCFANL